jgi:cell division protein FtsL
VFGGLNYVLDKHYDEVKKHAWPLLCAVSAYVNLFTDPDLHFNKNDEEEIVRRVVELLSELGDTVLGTIAWARVLVPALYSEYVRMLTGMKFKERWLLIDVIKKVDYVLNKLNELRENVKELLRDEKFMGYVKSKSLKADENMVKMIILDISLYLMGALAFHKLMNDKLNEAVVLFKEIDNKYKEICDYERFVENYLINLDCLLRAKALENSLVGNELVKEYAQLFNEALGNLNPTARYLISVISPPLGNYLVSLALTNNVKEVSKLLEEHWKILNINKKVSVLARLMLNVLLGPKDKLSDRLKDMLMVGPEELIEAFKEEMLNVFLPALKVAYGLVKHEDGIRECEELAKDRAKIFCKYAVLAVRGRGDAIERVRGLLINRFRKLILIKEKRDLLKELGVDYNELLSMFEKFIELVYELDGRSLVQLIAPKKPRAHLALILCALLNGNHELVKASALYGTTLFYSKLYTRLFLEAYKACCDLSGENFRKALARLLFCHV